MHGDKFPMGYSLYRAYECAVIRRICCYGKTQQACRAFCVASLASLRSEHSDSLAACGIATCYLASKPRTMQISAGKLVGFFSPLRLQGVWDVINLHYSLLKQRDQRKGSQKAQGLECNLSLLLPKACWLSSSSVDWPHPFQEVRQDCQTCIHTFTCHGYIETSVAFPVPR